jgi:hypothetical protein
MFDQVFAAIGHKRRARPTPPQWADSRKQLSGRNPLLDSTGQRIRWVTATRRISRRRKTGVRPKKRWVEGFPVCVIFAVLKQQSPCAKMKSLLSSESLIQIFTGHSATKIAVARSAAGDIHFEIEFDFRCLAPRANFRTAISSPVPQ